MSASPRPTIVHVTTVSMSLRFLRGQISYMRAKGFDVAVVSSPDEELWRFAEEERVQAWGVSMSRRISPRQDLAAAVSLFRIFRRVEPVLVHSHTPKGGLLGMVAAACARVPARIYQLRGMPMETATGLSRSIFRNADTLSAKLSHLVVANSASLRRAAIERRICPSWKITVIHHGSGNGVDAVGQFNPSRLPGEAGGRTRQRLNIPPDALVIGYVGRLVRDKGIVDLTEAWRQLRDRYPELHLLIVGFFEDRDRIPDAVRRTLEADERVCLSGEDWNTPPLYAAMDIVALPSYREGFPNVLLEAAAMSKPVVSTTAVGCADAVQDGATGTLVPPGDIKALVDALARYANDRELRAVHGRAGRQRVIRDFRPEDIWRGLHREYVRLLASHGCQPEAVQLLGPQCSGVE